MVGLNAQAVVRKPYDGVRYAGMDYESSSRWAEELVRAALLTGCWRYLPGHLSALAANCRFQDVAA